MNPVCVIFADILTAQLAEMCTARKKEKSFYNLSEANI